MKVRITNSSTGEVVTLEGTLYVALNGLIFVKSGSRTVWASNDANLTAEVI